MSWADEYLDEGRITSDLYVLKNQRGEIYVYCNDVLDMIARTFLQAGKEEVLI